MERTFRKRNRLKEFDYGEPGSYFLTLCTHNRAVLFEWENTARNGPWQGDSPPANAIVHRWIGVIAQRYPNIIVEKYVVMPDHMHLLLSIVTQVDGAAVPDVMQFFKTMTTNEYIRMVKEGVLPRFDKHVWQKSYFDHIVRNQADFNEVCAYIDGNPAKWQAAHHPAPRE